MSTAPEGPTEAPWPTGQNVAHISNLAVSNPSKAPAHKKETSQVWVWPVWSDAIEFKVQLLAISWDRQLKL